jgi:hypothetical protein
MHCCKNFKTIGQGKQNLGYCTETLDIIFIFLQSRDITPEKKNWYNSKSDFTKVCYFWCLTLCINFKWEIGIFSKFRGISPEWKKWLSLKSKSALIGLPFMVPGLVYKSYKVCLRVTKVIEQILGILVILLQIK